MFYLRSYIYTVFFVYGLSTATSQSISTLTGSQVELTCNYRVTSNGFIIWRTGTFDLSQNTQILNNAPEKTPRLNITGNHSDGEYNLMISDVKKTDEGTYECYVYGNANVVQSQLLIVIVAPTSLQIQNKQNVTKLLGTEGQDLDIGCTANGGDPAPNMTLMIGIEVFTGIQQTIVHTITRIHRSYDGVNITCQAEYDGVTFTSLTDTAVIRLNLKPLPPSFSMNPVETENIKELAITCTSTGSRPAPSHRIWLIGNSNVDITSSSTDISLSLQPNKTYIAKSTLMYKVDKDYNQQNLTCGFKNTVTGNNFIQTTTKMNITYAPTVSVQNITFSLSHTAREIHCNIDGNPRSTFIKWQHKSKYGIVIREFDQGSTLILPEQDTENRYQDTGEYVCMTSNGIRDENDNLNQFASGYVVSKAPPQSPDGSYQEVLGEYRHNVTLTVIVYSVPKYTTLTWLRDGDVITQSSKYTMTDVPDIITDVFYGKTVRVDGFKLTLTIKQLEESDFTNYTLTLSNGIDETLQHLIMLISANKSESGVVQEAVVEDPAIVVTIGFSVLAAVVVIIVAVVIIRKKRRSDKMTKTDKKMKRKIKRQESNFDDEDGLKDNILYQSVDSEKKPQEPCVYAQVQKPNAVYAEVKKPEPRKKEKEKKQKGVDNSSFEEYAYQVYDAKAGNGTSGYRNADGLKYVDVRFSNPPKGGKPVIHGVDERTIYSEVDHKKKAPPQEGDYELADVSHGK